MGVDTSLRDVFLLRGESLYKDKSALSNVVNDLFARSPLLKVLRLAVQDDIASKIIDLLPHSTGEQQIRLSAIGDCFAEDYFIDKTTAAEAVKVLSYGAGIHDDIAKISPALTPTIYPNVNNANLKTTIPPLAMPLSIEMDGDLSEGIKSFAAHVLPELGGNSDLKRSIKNFIDTHDINTWGLLFLEIIALLNLCLAPEARYIPDTKNAMLTSEDIEIIKNECRDIAHDIATHVSHYSRIRESLAKAINSTTKHGLRAMTIFIQLIILEL